MTILATAEEMQRSLGSGVLRNQVVVVSRRPFSNEYMTPRMYVEHFNEDFMRKARCGKTIRPWTFVNPADHLDPSQVWVGFEVESGYRSMEDYNQAMRLLEDSDYRVCVDPEGTGEVPAEITFAPVNLSDLRRCAGPEHIISLAQLVSPARHRADAAVGTHLNLSTPAMRDDTFLSSAETRNYFYIGLCLVMGDVLMGMSGRARSRITGRARVYRTRPEYHAGFGSDPRRIEFKWFNTTYQARRWERYCEVTDAVAQFVLDEERHASLRNSVAVNETYERFRAVINSLLPENLRT